MIAEIFPNPDRTKDFNKTQMQEQPSNKLLRRTKAILLLPDALNH